MPCVSTHVLHSLVLSRIWRYVQSAVNLATLIQRQSLDLAVNFTPYLLDHSYKLSGGVRKVRKICDITPSAPMTSLKKFDKAMEIYLYMMMSITAEII